MTDRLSLGDIEQAAARWVIWVDAGGLNDDEQAAFARWLASDTRCKGALLQAKAAWLPLYQFGQGDQVSQATDPGVEERGDGWRRVSSRGTCSWGSSAPLRRR